MLQEKPEILLENMYFLHNFIEEGDIKRFKINNENVVKISKAGETKQQLNTLPIYVKILVTGHYQIRIMKIINGKCMLQIIYRITSIHIGSGINRNNLFLNITIASDSSLDWIGCSSSGT